MGTTAKSTSPTKATRTASSANSPPLLGLATKRRDETIEEPSHIGPEMAWPGKCRDTPNNGSKMEEVQHVEVSGVKKSKGDQHEQMMGMPDKSLDLRDILQRESRELKQRFKLQLTKLKSVVMLFDPFY